MRMFWEFILFSCTFATQLCKPHGDVPVYWVVDKLTEKPYKLYHSHIEDAILQESKSSITIKTKNAGDLGHTATQTNDR